jgi:hypothetical protein
MSPVTSELTYIPRSNGLLNVCGFNYEASSADFSASPFPLLPRKSHPLSGSPITIFAERKNFYDVSSVARVPRCIRNVDLLFIRRGEIFPVSRATAGVSQRYFERTLKTWAAATDSAISEFTRGREASRRRFRVLGKYWRKTAVETAKCIFLHTHRLNARAYMLLSRRRGGSRWDVDVNS